MSKFASAAATGVVLPPLLLAVVVVLVMAVPQVRERFWPTPDANAAESAVLDDMARLRLLAGSGADLQASLPVRPSLLELSPPMATPLEAAIRAGHADAFDLILELLAVPPPAAEATRLRCLAQQRGETAIAERLSPLVDGSMRCE